MKGSHKQRKSRNNSVKCLPVSSGTKRGEGGKFTRSYEPVAKQVRYIDTGDTYYGVSGQGGLAWDHLGEGLEEFAAYDVEAMALVRNMGGLHKLVDQMFPTMNPERKARLIQNVQAIAHAKQRAEIGPRRRLTKSERRQLKKGKS
jgi:hypothetical protein